LVKYFEIDVTCSMIYIKALLPTTILLSYLSSSLFTSSSLQPSNKMSFTGKFEYVSGENFDEYLKACGVGMAKRTLASAAKPTIIISEAGGKYTMKTQSTLKNTEITFALGQEFDEETADGRKAKSTMVADGNKLIHTQNIGGEKSQTIREFTADQLKATFTANGVTATRIYKRA